MSDFWNNRYGQEAYVYGTQPNSFFAEKISTLKPGRILLPADGEGRNGVYAALQGWIVDAFDASEEGRKKAFKLAALKGVEINYDISTYMKYKPKIRDYDVIALIYTHMPGELRKAFHRKIQDWLRPGGSIILEAFDKSQLGNESGGPKDPDMLFDLNDLHEDFNLMDIILSESVITNLEEGNYHRGKANVVHIVALRK